MASSLLKAFGKFRSIILVALVILAGTAVRSYDFGSTPHGLAWDEAAIGYNGFAIFETRRDEWLHRLPVSFQSFGDYKAPLAIYINGLFTAVFGLSVSVVRLPFLLASIGMLITFPLVIGELWRGEKRKSAAILVGAIGIATSPWHIHYSRVAFESGFALTLVTISVFSFLKYRAEQRIVQQFFWSCFTAATGALSLYSYHSAKVTVPVLFLFLLCMYWSDIKKRFWSTTAGLLTGFVLIVPLLKDSILGMGLVRANVSVFSASEGIISTLSLIVIQVFAHLNHRFLVLGQTTTLRHGGGEWGVLLPTTYALVLISLLSVLWWLITEHARKIDHKSDRAIRRVKIGLAWIFAGILPAAIGIEIPHSNRALLALPGFLIVALEGAVVVWRATRSASINQKLYGSHGELDLLPKAVLGTALMVHLLLSMAFIENYFTKFAAQSAPAFSDGYLEAFRIAAEYEKGLAGKPEVDTIMFTEEYGQPYIYALFVRKTNPIWYQGGSLIKYQFANITASDLSRPNALVVASIQDKLPIELADHVVYGSDGEARFLLFKTPK